MEDAVFFPDHFDIHALIYVVEEVNHELFSSTYCVNHDFDQPIKK